MTALLAALLIGVLLFGVGAVLATFRLVPDLRVRLLFQPTIGTVSASDVHPWPGTGHFAAADIRFTYRVGDVEHADGRYRITMTRERDEDAFERVRRHPIGSAHPAWYDPVDPSVAVLARSFHPVGWIGVALCVTGLVLPVLLWRGARRVRRGR